MPKFAKRHYVFLATFHGEQLRYADDFGERNPMRVAAYEENVRALITALRAENPGFKPERFAAFVAKVRGKAFTYAG